MNEESEMAFPLTKTDIQELERVTLYVSLLKEEILSLNSKLNTIQIQQDETSKDLITSKYLIDTLKKKVSDVHERQEKSGIQHFLRQNWWKLASFVVALGTIIGAVMEYLYRLPPPMK